MASEEAEVEAEVASVEVEDKIWVPLVKFKRPVNSYTPVDLKSLSNPLKPNLYPNSTEVSTLKIKPKLEPLVNIFNLLYYIYRINT